MLNRRIAEYSPENLDDLCLSGEVTWARLSPHPALADAERHVRPTRIAPISFFAREDADWLIDPAFGLVETVGLSHAARKVYDALAARGASFFPDLVRETKRLPSEVEDALWELTAGGLVTADGFENLRALIDPKRRRGEGRGTRHRPRHAAGRWALVTRSSIVIAPDDRTRRFAQQLLLRWGVLFRDLLARESVSPPWRDLLPVLRHAWLLTVRFAAADLSRVLPANNSRAPKPSICCARSGALRPMTRKSPMFPQPIH